MMRSKVAILVVILILVGISGCRSNSVKNSELEQFSPRAYNPTPAELRKLAQIKVRLEKGERGDPGLNLEIRSLVYTVPEAAHLVVDEGAIYAPSDGNFVQKYTEVSLRTLLRSQQFNYASVYWKNYLAQKRSQGGHFAWYSEQFILSLFEWLDQNGTDVYQVLDARAALIDHYTDYQKDCVWCDANANEALALRYGKNFLFSALLVGDLNSQDKILVDDFRAHKLHLSGDVNADADRYVKAFDKYRAFRGAARLVERVGDRLFNQDKYDIASTWYIVYLDMMEAKETGIWPSGYHVFAPDRSIMEAYQRHSNGNYGREYQHVVDKILRRLKTINDLGVTRTASRKLTDH